MRERTTTLVSANTPNITVAIAFLRTVEAGVDPSELVTADVVEEELPNRLSPNGATRDLSAMRAGIERGKSVFKTQNYEIRNMVGGTDYVAFEIDWQGELAVAFVGLEPGTTMRARVAFFFEIREGHIAKIRHYDCFEPF
jgi:predicted ester cyclase